MVNDVKNLNLLSLKLLVLLEVMWIFLYILNDKPKFAAWHLGSSIGGGGGTHKLRHTGMCHFNESLFHKKTLNMGPIFYKNIPKHKSAFHKFLGAHFVILTRTQHKALFMIMITRLIWRCI